jgi:uroporphyrin-III C-methyltransferase
MSFEDEGEAACARAWIYFGGWGEGMTVAEKGVVYLVGAGPGDPELLTVRALRLLETADVVFHDDLVPEEVLALVHRHALITSVGKRCGRPRITQAGIHALLIASARAGQSVVRLKSGDPLVFGRAGEEIAALRGAGISFEVVPGVTAALAAGAALGLPLTDRKSASKLIFVTGHHADGKDSAPVWSGALPEDATLVVYMPGRDMGRIARELREAGVGGDVACAAVSHAATARQSWVASRLDELGELRCGAAPVLLLVGRAMEALVRGDADQRVLAVVDEALEMRDKA